MKIVLDTRKELDYKPFIQKDEFYQEPYENEPHIYQMIKDGDIEGILYNKVSLESVASGIGTLSDDPVKNHIYRFIINAVHITRICSSAGLPHEIAKTIFENYIRQADKCKTVDEVRITNDAMVIDFTKQMKDLGKNRVLSPKIRKVINYICNNLDKKITVDQLAKLTGLNKSYLCSLFKKEISVTIQKYILLVRVETAQKMLIETDFKEADISYTLGFSTQSYFCKCFKDLIGSTPHEYRKLYKVEYE